MIRTMMKTAAAAVLAAGLAAGVAEAQTKRVRLAYVEWSDAVVATNILKTALESKGYQVTM
jgi:glycine betaine/proline transport system substrate-binding protein